MPAVIFPGPEGRLEGRFQPATRPRAPVAMILHPHPQAGGTMNDRITQALYKTFVARGFATLRFNFRGVGRSQGSFDNGIGELSDAPPRSTGCSPSTPKPRPRGSPATASAR
jgi:alpha/beta superfamily hydrolase